MFCHVKRPDGGYKKSVVDVLERDEIEKLIDDTLSEWSGDGDSHTHGDDVSNRINEMLVNRERSWLYSVYYFTSGDATNFARNNVEVNKTMTVEGEGGINVEVIDIQIVVEVVNWYNCSRYSISEDDSDSTLFLSAGGTND